MTWVKIDDQFFSHPKIIDLSKDAKLLHLASLTYAASQLTDGKLTPGAVRVAAAMVDVDRRCLPELVKAGLWEEIPDGYQIHDYLEYNPTAEEVKQQRQENAKRQAEWRERKKAARNKDRNAVTNTVTNEEVTGDVTDVSQVPRTRTRTPSRTPKTVKDESRDRSLAPAVPSRERPRDLLWDQLVAEMGPAPTTPSGRGSWNAALKQLRAAGDATPEEIRIRCQRYRRAFADAALTPPALAKYWGQLSQEPEPRASPKGRGGLTAVDFAEKAMRLRAEGMS